MITNQTVENDDDLLKVLDNMLSEAGTDHGDLNGELTFAGLDPIRPTVLKLGAAGAAERKVERWARSLVPQLKPIRQTEW